MTGHRRVVMMIALILPLSLILLYMIRYETAYGLGKIPGLVMVIPADNLQVIPGGIRRGE